MQLFRVVDHLMHERRVGGRVADERVEVLPSTRLHCTDNHHHADT